MCMRLLELELAKIGVVPAKAPPPKAADMKPTGRVYRPGDEIDF